MKTINRVAILAFACATPAAMANTRPQPPPSAVAMEFSREQLGAQLEENIATGERALQAARFQAGRLRGEARMRFEAATRDLRAATLRLQESLAAAQDASVGEWEHARATLAADYEAYTRALTEAQRITLSVTAEHRGRSRPGPAGRQQ